MTWILLRGLAREARHWSDFPAQLARHTGTQDLVALDTPGNGEFFSVPSPDTVREMVEFLRQQTRARKLLPPYKLLAMSLGGMVAADWAQHCPGEVARLVLINTSMRPHGSPTQRLRPATWPQLALLAARWNDADFVEHTVHRLTCNAKALRAQDLDAWRRIRQTAPVSTANAARQLWAAARFSCAGIAPPCPTLVLSSSGDQLVQPICSERLANAWQASYRQHPWAGHDLPHDDADWVCQQVAAWANAQHPA